MGALAIVALVIAGFGLALVRLAGTPTRFEVEPRPVHTFERAPGWETRTPPGTLVRQHNEEHTYAV